MSQALRTMLEDRFQLKVHRATEQQDMYPLPTIAKSGLQQTESHTPVAGDCQTIEQYAAAAQAAAPGTRVNSDHLCGRAFSSMQGMEFSSFTFSQLANLLSGQLDYFSCLDRTGVTDPFNFDLKGPAEGGAQDELTIRRLDALGLKIERVKAPAEYLVIDTREKPHPKTTRPKSSSRPRAQWARETAVAPAGDEREARDVGATPSGERGWAAFAPKAFRRAWPKPWRRPGPSERLKKLT